MSKIIGLTGGIGSGKSTVAQIFKELGIPGLDADVFARALGQEGGAAAPAILKRFGTLDRLELRKQIVSDPSAKRDLEAILHPMIRVESQKALAKLVVDHPGAPFVLYEAALLVEAGRTKDFDGLIVVTAQEALRIERITQRDSGGEETARAIVHAQISDADRVTHATHIITNDSDLKTLREQCVKVLEAITSQC
jgi:dephospho-CoA kinase